MTRRLLHSLVALPRGILIALEIAAVFCVLMACIVIYAMAMLLRGPVDLSFAKSYIEDVFAVPGKNVRATMGSVVASWPSHTGPIILDIRDLRVTSDGQPMMMVQNLSFALAGPPLFLGRVRPEKLILNAPVLTFERGLDGALHFAASGTSAPVPSSGTGNNEELIKSIIHVLFDDTSSDYGVFSRINQVEITRARIRVVDARIGMTWQIPDANLQFREVPEGIYGSLNVHLPAGQQFAVVMTYARAKDMLSVTSNFEDFPMASYVGRIMGFDWLRRQRLPVTGSMTLDASLKDSSVAKFDIDAHAAKGTLDLGDDAVPLPVPISDASIKLAYDIDTNGVNMPDFSFNLNGIPVRLSSSIGPQKGQPGNFSGDLIMRAPDIKLATVQEMWPEALRSKPAAKWIVERLSGADVHHLEMRLPVFLSHNDGGFALRAMEPRVTFDFEKLKADYHAPLFPVEGGAGKGVFENDSISIDIEKGHIRGLDVAGSKVLVTDLGKDGAGEAHIDLVMKGPVADVVRYVSLDPVNLGDKFPVKPDDIKGTGDYTAKITFPTLKELPADRVDVDVDAKLNGLVLPGLVRGMALEGGPFDLVFDDGAVHLSGTGTLAGRSAKIDFLQPIDPAGKKIAMSLKARIDTDEAMRTRIGGNIAGIYGSLPVYIEYEEYTKGHERVVLDMDFTPTRIALSSPGYRKDAGKKASAGATLTLRSGVITDVESLRIEAPDIKINKANLTFGTIKGARTITGAEIPVLGIGKSDARLTMRRDANLTSVSITGKRIDLAPFLKDAPPGNADNKAPAQDDGAPSGFGPVQVTLKTDVLSMGGREDLKNADISLRLNDKSDIDRIELAGRAGGDVNLRYVPDDAGRMTLRLRAENAGAFFRAMDVYDNMIGGVLMVDGSPIGNNNRDVKGNLVIKDFSIVKAPVLAQILGGMSLSGVAEQLGNKGIGFSRLESGFAWLRRSGQDLMSFREGRTSGSALGLTFDGIYNRRQGSVRASGTIIPVSGINTFASKIPLVGRLLTGGDGSALFAATYSVSGPASDPSVMINPLSVLTPGILRKMFFESSPRDPLRSTPSERGRMND